MNAHAIVVVASLACASASASEAVDPQLAPLEPGKWEVAAEVGTGAVNGYFVFIGYQPRADLRVDARAIFALNERVQLDALWPKAQARFELAPDLHVVAHAGVLAFSVYDDQFLYQTPQDPFIAVPPSADTPVTPRATFGAGGALRLLRPRHGWTFAIEASTTRPFTSRPFTIPFFTWDVSAGWTVLVGERVTIHLGLGVANSALLLQRLFTTPPSLRLGSVQHVGVRRPPLVRVRLTERVFADVSAAVILGVSGRVEAMAGVTWLVP